MGTQIDILISELAERLVETATSSHYTLDDLEQLEKFIQKLNLKARRRNESRKNWLYWKNIWGNK